MEAFGLLEEGRGGPYHTKSKRTLETAVTEHSKGGKAWHLEDWKGRTDSCNKAGRG